MLRNGFSPTGRRGRGVFSSAISAGTISLYMTFASGHQKGAVMARKANLA